METSFGHLHEIHTPVVCPRLFVFLLASLTFIAKKNRKHRETRKARCPHAISSLSRVEKNTTQVGRKVRQCWCRCIVCLVVYTNDMSRRWRVRKNDLCNRKQMTPQEMYLQNYFSKEKSHKLVINSKKNAPVKSVITFVEMAVSSGSATQPSKKSTLRWCSKNPAEHPQNSLRETEVHRPSPNHFELHVLDCICKVHYQGDRSFGHLLLYFSISDDASNAVLPPILPSEASHLTRLLVTRS